MLTVFPFVIYIIFSVVFVSETGENIMSIMEMVNPLQRYITTYGKLFGGMGGLFLATFMIVMFYLAGRKYFKGNAVL